MTKRKSNPRWPNIRPDISTDAIVTRYAAGESSPSIAASLRCSLRTVFMRLNKAGVSPRPRGKAPKPKREAAWSWKGNVIGYKQQHTRVELERGKPQACERCGCTDPNVRYEWANLTDNYLDVNDFQRMCAGCHRRYDASRRRESTTGRG